MDVKTLTERLAASGDAIRAMFGGISVEQARWRPAPDRWSMLEVLNHLADEEREDFRARLGSLLLHVDDYDPTGRPWPGIDPPAWVRERDYNGRALDASLADFLDERQRSLRWLAGLEGPVWTNAYEHPLLGTLRAGDLAASWIAHDLLHLRQLGRLNFDRLAMSAPEFSPSYAGKW